MESSVSCEAALVLLSYNIKRVVNIMGIKELMSKLRELRPLHLFNYKLMAA